jgi:hypothetical protein
LVISLVQQTNDPRRGVISLVHPTETTAQQSPQAFEDAFLVTGEETDPSEVIAQTPADYQARVRSMLDQAYLTPDRQANVDAYRLGQMQEKLGDFMGNPDLFYEATMFLGNGNIEAIDARIATNTLIVRRLNQDIQDQESNGFFDAVLDFAGVAVSEIALGPLEKIRQDPVSEQLGREVQQAMSTMPPSEFKSWYENDFLVRAAEKGIGRNNAWYISEYAAASLNAGYNPNAAMEAVMSLAFDVPAVGSLAGSFVRGAGRIAGRAGATEAVMGATTPVGRVAAVEGSERAAEVAAAKIAAEEAAGTVAIREITGTGPGHLDPSMDAARASETAFARANTEGTLLYRLNQLYRSGTAGHVVNPETVAANADSILKTAADNIGYPILRTSHIEDVGLGMWRAVMHVGKSDGTEFALTKLGNVPKKVTELADEIGGEVRIVKPAVGKPKAVIEVKQTLDMGDYVDALTDEDLLIKMADEQRSLLGKLGSAVTAPMRFIAGSELMASRATLAVNKVQGLAELGEAASNAFKAEFTKTLKGFQKLRTEDQRAISAVLTSLRDGDAAAVRQWFSDIEFADRYRAVTGKEPSQKVIDAYHALVDVSDAAYVIEANAMTMRYARMGYKTLHINGEYRTPGKLLSSTDNLKATDNIFDSEFGVYKWGDSVADGVAPKVWKLDKPVRIGDSFVEYVVKPNKVSELEPSSVLGYNPGGPRTNPVAKHFVVGQTKGGRMRAMLSTFTPEEADLAMREIGNIRKAAAEGKLTDEVIEANNTWNPNLLTVRGFEEFAEKAGWKDFADTPLGRKAHDDRILEAEAGFDDANTGLGTSEYIKNDQRRLDRVLNHFGGEKTFNQDPITNIAAQFGSASHELAFNAYTRVAMHSWVNRVKEIAPQWLPKGVSAHDTRNLFLNAKVVGNDPVANALRRIQNVERRRMAIKSPLAQSIERGNERLTNWIFNKSGKTVSFNGLNDKLLQVGFHSALGMFNPRQALIQTTHAIAIMAMVPKHGMRGASMSQWLRPLFHADVEVVEAGLRRAAKHYGITYEDMADMFEYARTSGRNIIEADAMEIGTGISFNVPGYGASAADPSVVRKAWDSTKQITRKTLDLGTAPYAAGERTSRMTGLWTALNEWKAANPGKMINADARLWISRREHTLNLNMTNTSRRMAQEGLMRVPTQWLSHSLSVFEGIFVGRNLSVGERARLAMIYGPFYGTTGVGMGWASAEIAEMLGIKEDSALYTTLKWGFIDGMMDALLPDGDFGKVGTGLSTSLSPWAQLSELHRKFTEETAMEAVMGPSGAIAGNITSAVLNTFGSIYRGDTAMLQEDIIKLLRQPSSIDNVWKGIGILNNGVYRSKNGVTVPGEMSATEGLLQILGIGSLKTQEFYEARTRMFRDNRALAADRKWVNDRQRIALDHLTSGDPERARRGHEMIKELSAWIQFSGHSPANMRSLYNSLGNVPTDQMAELMRSMMRMDRQAEMSRLSAVIGR